MIGRIRVAGDGEIAPGGSRLIQGPGGPIAVFRVGDDYFALDDNCPHRAGPLSEGVVTNGAVRCPWHGARFDLRTGAALEGPTTRAVPCHRVLVENGEIVLEVAETGR